MKNNDPFRKIVDHFVSISKDGMGVKHLHHYDVLECGHLARQSNTATYRRRCHECGLTKRAADASPRGGMRNYHGLACAANASRWSDNEKV